MVQNSPLTFTKQFRSCYTQCTLRNLIVGGLLSWGLRGLSIVRGRRVYLWLGVFFQAEIWLIRVGSNESWVDGMLKESLNWWGIVNIWNWMVVFPKIWFCPTLQVDYWEYLSYNLLEASLWKFDKQGSFSHNLNILVSDYLQCSGMDILLFELLSEVSFWICS